MYDFVQLTQTRGQTLDMQRFVLNGSRIIIIICKFNIAYDPSILCQSA